MGRADAKAGLSDPAVLDGKAVAQQIKGTPGITGLSPLSVHSGEEVWHLDVGSSHPGGGEAPKGLAVRQMKAVRELGLDRRETGRSLSAAGAGDLRRLLPSTRGLGGTYLWSVSCPARGTAE